MDARREIKVKITGKQASGKTTAAWHIAQALADCGARVTLVDEGRGTGARDVFEPDDQRTEGKFKGLHVSIDIPPEGVA